MRKTTRIAALVAALMTCTILPLSAATPSEFYGNLLRRGVAAYDAGRYEDAARQLRIAAFGLVEAVESYEFAQVYLTLAWDKAGQTERATDAAKKLLAAERVERRYASLKLPAAVRAAFEKVAARVLSTAEMSGLHGTAPMPAATTQGPRIVTTTRPATTQQPPVTVEHVDVEVTKQPSTTATGEHGTNHNTAAPPQTTSSQPQQPATAATTQQQQRTTQPPVQTTTTATPSRSTATTTSQQPHTTQPPTQSTTTAAPSQSTTTTPPRTTTTATPSQSTTTTTPQTTTQSSATTTSPQPHTTRPPAQSTTTATQPRTTTTATPSQSTTTTSPQTTTQSSATTTTHQPQPRTSEPPAPPATTTRVAPVLSATEIANRFAAGERALIGSELTEARRLYREVLDSANVSHDNAVRAAEGLYRARDFAGALDAFERAGALRRGEEPYRYYIAVALYETGQIARARRELAAALPFIEVTPDVARYRAKIESAIAP